MIDIKGASLIISTIYYRYKLKTILLTLIVVITRVTKSYHTKLYHKKESAKTIFIINHLSAIYFEINGSASFSHHLLDVIFKGLKEI